jgi:hypothetical protein
MQQPSCQPHHQRQCLRLAWIAALLPALAGPAAAEFPVAGTQPWARPVGAPQITSVTHDPAWFQRAMHGISPPHPQSLRWLDDQGNWYTPFTRPGMPPPYDIRGWHATPAKR